MSPVKQSNPRTAALAVGGALLGLIGVAALFVFALQQGSRSGDVEVRLGSETFEAGSADRLAASIAEDGPLLFADPAGGDRDIYLQHIGDTPETGWLAFDNRRPGLGRDCPLDWRADPGEFVDPCDGTVVAADGSGLTQYDVEVTEDGDVVIDFQPDDE